VTPIAELRSALSACAECLERQHLVGVREREVLAQSRAALARRTRRVDLYETSREAFAVFRANPDNACNLDRYFDWLFEEAAE
jgi:hypothetical protein